MEKLLQDVRFMKPLAILSYKYIAKIFMYPLLY